MDELPDPKVAKEDRSLLSKGPACIPDLKEQAAMLQWAGVDFGEDNCFYLQKSLKDLPRCLEPLVSNSSVKSSEPRRIIGLLKDNSDLARRK